FYSYNDAKCRGDTIKTMARGISVRQRIVVNVAIAVEILRIRRPGRIGLVRNNAVRAHDPRQHWSVVARMIIQQAGPVQSLGGVVQTGLRDRAGPTLLAPRVEVL